MHISDTIFNIRIPIIDVSIQFKLCQYCITGLMYHDMAIYRYIVASLVNTYKATYICMCFAVIVIVVPEGSDDSSDAGAIAGGVVAALLVVAVILLVLVLIFIW